MFGSIKSILLLLLTSLLFYCQDKKNDKEFQKLNDSGKWELTFLYSGSEDWTDYWFLDGQLSKITNSENGMHFKAGPIPEDDAHHAVLWTKKSFKGDLKIEFDYTKTDSLQKYVNILYIQATGTGKHPYLKDISKWNNLRKTPSMRTYFKHMNALHVSYSAISPDGMKYVRARRYPVTKDTPFKKLVITPSYDNIDEIFRQGISYHITVVKTIDKLFFKVEGDNCDETFYWDLTQKESITEGRIGLRHMFARSALYKDFKIYVKR